jgi:7-keto-8-aminopelargonate synthetase-like enzyme
VATSQVIADWLVQRARSFVYTTFLPPPVLAANQAAVDVVQGPEGGRLRGRVLDLADRLRERLAAAGLRPGGAGTPIVSLSLTPATAATGIARDLVDRGFLCWAFRPPTVPDGTSLIRIGLSAAHHEDEVAGLAAALIDVVRPGVPAGGGFNHD